MAVSKQVTMKLDQIEQELSAAMLEFPTQIALDRLKFVRALVRFVKTQIDLDEEPALTLSNGELPSRERH